MSAAGLIDWSLKGLETEAAHLLPGFVAERVATIDSSNSELMRRARAGRIGPTLLLAETQTAGRGRMGRCWHSAPPAQAGDSLTFSLGLLLLPRDWSGLSLALGVSIAQTLDPVSVDRPGPRVQLKWPNDIWWQERKLGGVLIETVNIGSSLYAVIGIGLNIRRPAVGEFATPPAGLRELRVSAQAPEVLRSLLLPLLATVLRFCGEGFPAFRAGFDARDALRGREVMGVSGPDGTDAPAWSGVACGVDDAGALLVHTAGGMRRIVSSEVRIRPVAGLLQRPGAED